MSKSISKKEVGLAVFGLGLLFSAAAAQDFAYATTDEFAANNPNHPTVVANRNAYHQHDGL